MIPLVPLTWQQQPRGPAPVQLLHCSVQLGAHYMFPQLFTLTLLYVFSKQYFLLTWQQQP